uniref:Uncharacterized protein n=1 Tax=Oryza punctata TaxID=4537 RepID=A0A0E0KPW7_ORYPU
MEHSKKFIGELQKDSAADSGSGSEPLTAEAKTHLVVDGKKIQLQEEDSHQGSRSARDLIRFTLMTIRFAILAVMHHYYRQMATIYQGTTLGILNTCFHYVFIAIIILASYMGI